jgi:hypothetical protein
MAHPFPKKSGFLPQVAAGPAFAARWLMMRAVFHIMAVTADVTDFEFHMLAYYVSGTFKQGMLVRFRPQSRLLRTYLLESVEFDETFSELEHRPCYNLRIDCGSLESVEFLHDLQVKGEDIELVELPKE